MTVCGFKSPRPILLCLILASAGIYFTPAWTDESRKVEHLEYLASARARQDLTTPNLLEPAYILLRPTVPHLQCNLTLKRSDPFSGFLEHSGNCQGFIGSVILIDVEDNLRQAAEMALPNKVTWHTSMKKIDKALLTIYSDVLPHELLADVEWVKDDAVLYHPKVTAVNVSVIDVADHQTNVAASVIRDEKVALQQGETIFWENHTLRGLARDFDLSCYHSAQFQKIWIVGTSESRQLFYHMCSAISDTPPVLDKTTMRGQCGNLYFINTCQWYCGCDFTPFLQSEPDLSGQLISASCGLHSEYLKDSNHLKTTLGGLSDWALALKSNQTKVQFRVSNAVNPLKTIPEKYVIARNNFRYHMFRDVAMSTLADSNVRVMDAFRVTEPVFDLSEDHVHYPPWVYGELARMFFKSLCDMD